MLIMGEKNKKNRLFHVGDAMKKTTKKHDLNLKCSSLDWLYPSSLVEVSKSKQKVWVQKNLDPKKNWVQKNFLFQKNIWSNKILGPEGPKFVWVQQNFMSKNNFGSKNI